MGVYGGDKSDWRIYGVVPGEGLRPNNPELLEALRVDVSDVLAEAAEQPKDPVDKIKTELELRRLWGLDLT